MRVDTNYGTIELPKIPRITEDVITVFKFGHCHSLALAIHDLTKWQLVGLYRPWRDENETPDHVVIKMPDGHLLDIKGVDELKRYRRPPVPFTREEIVNFKDYRPANPKMAQPYAVKLLQRVGYYPKRKRRSPVTK